MRRGWAFCGDYCRAGSKRFSTGQGQLVFVQRFHAGVQAHGFVWTLFGELRGDHSHAKRRERSVSLGKHLEDKFKHAAGGFQLAVEQYSPEKRTEEMVDHVARKAFCS